MPTETVQSEQLLTRSPFSLHKAIKHLEDQHK